MRSHEEFVDAAYGALLRREPDAEGRTNALVALQNGMSLRTYLDAILNSAEYLQLQAEARAIVPGFKPACVLVDDRLRLWIDLADTVVSMGCLAGNYEPQETRFVLQTLAPGDVFVDIGANLGWFTILAADRVGSAGQVHAFEPGSLTRGLLQRSVDDNGFGDRVQIHSVALGDAPRQGHLLSDPAARSHGGLHMAPAGDAGSAGFAGQDVDVRPLDALAIDRRVKLIKMDVEGSEPLVLRGAQNLIARDRPLILAEVYDELLRLVSGTDAAGFRRQVRDMGYRIHAIRDGAVGEVVTDDAVIGIDRPANVILVPA